MLVREDEPVAEGIERGEVPARKKAELRPVVSAGACAGDRVRESALGASLPFGIEQAAVDEAQVARIRFVERAGPFHREVLISDEPQRPVQSRRKVAAARAGVGREHDAGGRECIQDGPAQAQHAEILARCGALSFCLHLQEADIPAADAPDESCATENGHGNELRRQPDPA
jgi:hypothetical protein